MTSDTHNPVRPVGSAVTLTCTSVLADYIDGLTVNMELSGPNGFREHITADRVGSTTTYTSTATVNSFGRAQSGNYTCSVIIISRSPFITTSATHSTTSKIFVGMFIWINSSYNNLCDNVGLHLVI